MVWGKGRGLVDDRLMASARAWLQNIISRNAGAFFISRNAGAFFISRNAGAFFISRNAGAFFISRVIPE